MKKIPFMDVPITAVSRCYRDKHVLAANSIGEMGLFDLRSKSELIFDLPMGRGWSKCVHPTE